MCFFFNDTATTEIYTLSLHDALPISFAVPTADAPLEVSDDSAAWVVSVSSLFAARKLAIGGDGKLRGGATATVTIGDRKSTRLNSSHANISYAVFCLKKKTTIITYSY